MKVDLPTPGHAGNADPDRIAGMGQQFGQQLFRPRAVIGAGRFDQGDGAGKGAAVTLAVAAAVSAGDTAGRRLPEGGLTVMV